MWSFSRCAGAFGVLERLGRSFGEALVGDQRLGLRVAEDVRDLLRVPVPVERDEAEAGVAGRADRFEVLAPVPGDDGEDVARLRGRRRAGRGRAG